MNGWIPTSERMPERNVRVLAFLRHDDHFGVHCYELMYFRDNDDWEDSMGHAWPQSAVTYWRVLPPLPEDTP